MCELTKWYMVALFTVDTAYKSNYSVSISPAKKIADLV